MEMPLALAEWRAKPDVDAGGAELKVICTALTAADEREVTRLCATGVEDAGAAAAAA